LGYRFPTAATAVYHSAAELSPFIAFVCVLGSIGLISVVMPQRCKMRRDDLGGLILRATLCDGISG